MEHFDHNSKEYFENKKILNNSIQEKKVNKLLDKITYKNYTGNEFSNVDLDEEHIENAFANEKYYYAMKNIPLIEKKVLYWLIVRELGVKQVSKILNKTPNEILTLKNQAINHFKENLSKGVNGNA